MPRVIAVANQKGGVGKTTSTVNLAVVLAAAGLSVLAVDLDPQCNATNDLGVDASEAELTMYEVLASKPADRVGVDEGVVATEHGPSLLVGSEALADIDQNGAGPGGEQLLAVQLSRSQRQFDVVLLDCPPSLGRLTVMALLAADEALAPVGTGYNDLDGLVRLMDTVERIRANNGRDDLAVAHVLVTSYDGRTQLSKDIARALRSRFPDEYLGVVHETVRVPEASARSMPVVAYRPECTAAEDYRELGKLLSERIAA